MPDAAASSLPDGAESAEGAARETGILVRAYRAFELLFSVHAKLARREAGEDLRRVLSGLVLIAVALSLAGFAMILSHAAAVVLVQRRLQWDMSVSIGAVAGADLLVALVLSLVARGRLRTPVLAETRAMVKKAAGVLRG